MGATPTPVELLSADSRAQPITGFCEEAPVETQSCRPHCGASRVTTAEQSGCDKHRMAHKSQKCLLPGWLQKMFVGQTQLL